MPELITGEPALGTLLPTPGGRVVNDVHAPVIPAPSDVVPPVVANFDPAPGTPLGRMQAVAFDATDETGFCDLIVWASMVASGATELVYDGDGFTPQYAELSSTTPISGGFRFTVRRTGGWIDDPTIFVRAVDRGGNVSS